MIKLVVYGVKFKNALKMDYYKFEEELAIDDLVVVSTDRGEYLGRVATIKDIKDDSEIESIIRRASDDDYEAYITNLKDSSIAYKKAIEFAKDLGLDMNIISANFNLDRSQLLFNFTADGRVDFRELAKKLAGMFRTRIELRQVGARDKAKEVGGFGICGGKLCCTKFLGNVGTINMQMAKNQNLALNPSKINGACGRLLCCLSYEDENYIENLKDMPSVGDVIKTPKGEAQVIGLDVLNCKCKILIDGEKEDYVINSKK